MEFSKPKNTVSNLILLLIATTVTHLLPSGFAFGDCFDLTNSLEIQSQFQWIQHAGTNIPKDRSLAIKELVKENAVAMADVDCVVQHGEDPARLSAILSLIKLNILQLRIEEAAKNKNQVAANLKVLRRMTYLFLNQSSLIARRLGASVRSLMLDEMERLLNGMPELVKAEVGFGYWRSDFSESIAKELRLHWQNLKAQIPKNQTPTSLARHFGGRSWKPAMNYRSRLSRLLAGSSSTPEETLEGQTHFLFRENKNNLSLLESEKVIEHYLQQSLNQMKKNNYFVLKDWLAPVIDSKIKNLKQELGQSWPLISPLVGINLEGPFKELEGAVELLTEAHLEKAKVDYARTPNPLGRLYEIVFLKRLTQMWSPVDMAQLKQDLNRVTSIKTLLAVQDYQKKFARWPKGLNELVGKKLLEKEPRDYFNGRGFKYDPTKKRIWSLGENGVDENGQGDDMALRLSL